MLKKNIDAISVVGTNVDMLQKKNLSRFKEAVFKQLYMNINLTYSIYMYFEFSAGVRHRANSSHVSPKRRQTRATVFE